MNPGTYILRVWREPSARDAWRASLTDAATREKVYFATPSALLRFLAERSRSDPTRGPEAPHHPVRAPPE